MRVMQRESNQLLRRELHTIYPGAAIRVSSDYATKIKWVDGVTPAQMIDSITHLQGMQYSKYFHTDGKFNFPDTARFYTEDFIKNALEGFFVVYSADIQAVPYQEATGFWWVRFHPNILPGFDGYFSVLFFQYINDLSGEFGKWPSIRAIKK